MIDSQLLASPLLYSNNLDLEGSLVYNSDLQVANIDLAIRQSSSDLMPATKLHFFCQESSHFYFRLNLLESKQGLFSQTMNIALPYDVNIGFEGKKAPDSTYDGQFKLKLLGLLRNKFQEDSSTRAMASLISIP